MTVITRKETEGLSDEQIVEPVPRAGLLVVYAPFLPQYTFFPVKEESLHLGRDELIAAGIHDDYTSKRHLRVDWDGERFTACDQNSTNGTFLNGRPLGAKAAVEAPSVIRIGRTLLLCVSNLGGALALGMREDGGEVLGPKLQAVY